MNKIALIAVFAMLACVAVACPRRGGWGGGWGYNSYYMPRLCSPYDLTCSTGVGYGNNLGYYPTLTTAYYPTLGYGYGGYGGYGGYYPRFGAYVGFGRWGGGFGWGGGFRGRRFGRWW